MSFIEKIKFYLNKTIKTKKQHKFEILESFNILEIAKEKNIDAKVVNNHMCDYLSCYDEATIEIEDKRFCSKHAKNMINYLTSKEAV